MQHILLLDNYDSFTFNISHALEGLDCKVTVVRNNVAISEMLQQFDKIVLSPGPGLPKDAGNMMLIIEKAYGKIPVLGICLGMQGISEFLGAELYNKNVVKHGVTDRISCKGDSTLFRGIPEEINVGLYHSWAVKESKEFQIDARSVSDDTIMAISRPDSKLFGVQFHPESVMTQYGKELFSNFLKL